MFTLRVVRHGHQEQILAECLTSCVPARGEVLQLDVTDAQGEPAGPSTLWRVISVTLHVPSLRSQQPADGSPLSVRLVEAAVLPDSELPTPMAQREREVLSEIL